MKEHASGVCISGVGSRHARARHVPTPINPKEPSACAEKEEYASAVLDLGSLVDAIHVAGGSHLTLLRLSVPNSASRQQPRPSSRVQLRVEGTFALWPSITLARGSSVCLNVHPCDLGFRVSSCEWMARPGVPGMPDFPPFRVWGLGFAAACGGHVRAAVLLHPGPGVPSTPNLSPSRVRGPRLAAAVPQRVCIAVHEGF